MYANGLLISMCEKSIALPFEKDNQNQYNWNRKNVSEICGKRKINKCRIQQLLEKKSIKVTSRNDYLKEIGFDKRKPKLSR